MTWLQCKFTDPDLKDIPYVSLTAVSERLTELYNFRFWRSFTNDSLIKPTPKLGYINI